MSKPIMLLVFSALILSPFSAEGQEGVRLKELMGPETYKECGLSKLDADELTHLEAWLASFVLDQVHAAKGANSRSAMKMPKPVGGDLNFAAIDGLVGASIIADDGTFLGRISRDKYSPESIANRYGQHGGEYAILSIFNKYGLYGGAYSPHSPFNPYATTPPVVFLKDRALAYLTVNKSITPRLDPKFLEAWINAE
jgi:hypothetical protein